MDDTADLMNTRSDIEALFELDAKGVITSPGKFEGEPAYVPYYWDKGLDGWADDEPDDYSYLFYVTKEDVNEFPELAGKDRVVVTISDCGFVYEITML